ncbi:putative Peroxidase 48 [Papaver somniferum]|uniref:putative Peroxidase 48 n=1 Tax=Papaver somniferum TaxID=3469 RepID=UPI000E6FE4C3|nr:putative Peroxidase 48 [Papaver somniferum]
MGGSQFSGLPNGKIVQCKFYLADAGFANMPQFITPYRGVRYHLKEFGGNRPKCAKELFNLRHASLRNAIERAIDILKRRFTILQMQPQYPFESQVKITVAPVLFRLLFHDCFIGGDGPFYPVPTGRRDSLVSFPEISLMELPAPTDDLSVILSKFLLRNFNEQETVSQLVNCKFILGRVNNFSGTGAPDPTIEIDFLKVMQAKCSDEREFIDLKNEGAAEAGFGTHFFQGLVQNKSVLRSDQQLMSEEKTATWVRAYASNNFLFIKDFSIAMIKLSNNGVLTGSLMGQIRVNCSSTL